MRYGEVNGSWSVSLDKTLGEDHRQSFQTSFIESSKIEMRMRIISHDEQMKDGQWKYSTGTLVVL